VGISFVTTSLARRAQIHQSRLVEKMNVANPQFQSALRGMTGVFSGGGAGPGSGPGTAQQHAFAMMQANVIRQSTMLAYIDNFWVLGVVIACLVPCVFLIKKTKASGMVVH